MPAGIMRKHVLPLFGQIYKFTKLQSYNVVLLLTIPVPRCQRFEERMRLRLRPRERV
jgi:hypothetical protein